MERVLLVAGWLGGLSGLALGGFAVIWRIIGYRWLAGFELVTLLQAGVAAMVAGCFFMLAALVLRSGGRR